MNTFCHSVNVHGVVVYLQVIGTPKNYMWQLKCLWLQVVGTLKPRITYPSLPLPLTPPCSPHPLTPVGPCPPSLLAPTEVSGTQTPSITYSLPHCSPHPLTSPHPLAPTEVVGTKTPSIAYPLLPLVPLLTLFLAPCPTEMVRTPNLV